MDKTKFIIVIILSVILWVGIYWFVIPEIYPDEKYFTIIDREYSLNERQKGYYDRVTKFKRHPKRTLAEIFSITIIFVIPSIYYLFNKK